MFTLGQKVWCLIYGEGEVADVDMEYDTCYVKFHHMGALLMNYTLEGVPHSHSQGNITLFPYPVEVVKVAVKPSIDWSHVSSGYDYLVQGSDGEGYLCSEKPSRVESGWNAESPFIEVATFTSYVPGTCDWKDSLVKRPE